MRGFCARGAPASGGESLSGLQFNPQDWGFLVLNLLLTKWLVCNIVNCSQTTGGHHEVASPPRHRHCLFLALHRFHLVSGHAERFLNHCLCPLWCRCRCVGLHSWFWYDIWLVRDKKHLALLDRSHSLLGYGVSLATHSASHGGFPCLRTKTGRRFRGRFAHQRASHNSHKLSWRFHCHWIAGQQKKRPLIKKRKNRPASRSSSIAGEETLPYSDRWARHFLFKREIAIIIQANKQTKLNKWDNYWSCSSRSSCLSRFSYEKEIHDRWWQRHLAPRLARFAANDDEGRSGR